MRPHQQRGLRSGALSAAAALGAVLVTGSQAHADPSIDIPAAVAAAAANACRPTFMKDGQPSPGGTAFVLHAPAFSSRDVLVSAHHLFGMATATTSGMPWQDVPRRVTSATCRTFEGKRVWRTSAGVAIAGVRAFWRLPDVKDVALLPLVAGPAPTLELSPRPAVPGDVVFVLAEIEQPLPTDVVIHRAHVGRTTSEGVLAFVYDEPRLRTANISGAAVVSAEGKVVGVNVGAGHLANGAVVGVADDLKTLEDAISSVPTS